mmetsp:Transcript_637/g.1341  ORF Transcript_637/g.1341 Transcript_637/m.1341 type:complete len:211 (+) Transcript_637:808-1440(+)
MHRNSNQPLMVMTWMPIRAKTRTRTRTPTRKCNRPRARNGRKETRTRPQTKKMRSLTISLIAIVRHSLPGSGTATPAPTAASATLVPQVVHQMWMSRSCSASPLMMMAARPPIPIPRRQPLRPISRRGWRYCVPRWQRRLSVPQLPPTEAGCDNACSAYSLLCTTIANLPKFTKWMPKNAQRATTTRTRRLHATTLPRGRILHRMMKMKR